jgi:hypothetical protein
MAFLYAHDRPLARRARRVAVVGGTLVLCAAAGTIAAASSVAPWR